MNILEHAIKLASEERPVGSIVVGCPSDRVGVWKPMDGIENVNPGTGLDYRSLYRQKTCLFERVA